MASPNLKKAAKIGLKILRKAVQFSLVAIGDALIDSAKKKEYEPTMKERLYGHKVMLTGEYVILPEDCINK